MKGRRIAVWSSLLLSAVLALAIWVLLVWVASRPALKALIDLTPQHVNSVDPATGELLRELRSQKAEIQFHQFYPPVAGQGATLEQQQDLRIQDRLRELTRLLLVRYQYLGGESVTVVAHDFYNASAETRKEAQRFDYKDAESDVLVVAVRMPGKEWRFKKLSLALDLGRIEASSASGNGGPTPRKAANVLKAYKGEEAISSAIKSLLVEGVPVAYVLQGYSPDLSEHEVVGNGYGQFLRSLQRNGFEVRGLRLDGKPVPADATLVVVIEPRRDFSDVDANSLFAYVQRGGRVFLNYSWAGVPDWNSTGGRFGELLGYELSVAPVFHKIPDNGRANDKGLDGDNAVARLQVNLSPGHPATRRIARSGRPIELVAARGLRERAGAPAAVRREPLLWTGDKAWLAVMDAQGMPSNRAPNIQLSSFIVGMACEVDVVADAAVTPAPGAPKTGQVVIVSGMFCNNDLMPGYGDLAVNICNWMAERNVLLDLKDTGYEAKYLQVQLPQIVRIRDVLVFGVPGVFLACGLVVFFLRRRQ